MIDLYAERIAIFMKKHNEGVVSVAVMKFALIIIFDILSVIALVILLGLFTNTFKESSLALFSFALLRFFSGGRHLESSINCVIVTVLMFSLMIFVPLPKEYEIWLQFISLILVFSFAPAYLQSHIRIRTKYIPYLRIASILIVCSNFYWDSSIVTKCFFIQSLTLIEIRKKGGALHENTFL